MQLLSRYKIPAIVAACAAIGLIWYMLPSGAPNDSLLTTEAIDETSSVADKSVVETLLTLRTVSLSGTIFSEPAFVGLQDFGTQIVLEPVGRENPFAPFSPSARTSTTTQPTQALPPARP